MAGVEDGTLDHIMNELRSRADPASLEGMARYGIRTDHALGGSSLYFLRAMAKDLGRDHALALALWSTEVHEARLLATLVEDPMETTEEQMEEWVAGFDSWDICDQCTSNVFSFTSVGWKKAMEWSSREEEFVKRAGFALMAALAVHDKKAEDERFLPFLSAIEMESYDDRNYVRKAVNWALRNIGKRNTALNASAIACAERIRAEGTKSGRWIASDALRELRSDTVKRRLAKHK
jgi:3-methyladenine DNA glycosylase AlkD